VLLGYGVVNKIQPTCQLGCVVNKIQPTYPPDAHVLVSKTDPPGLAAYAAI